MKKQARSLSKNPVKKQSLQEKFNELQKKYLELDEASQGFYLAINEVAQGEMETLPDDVKEIRKYVDMTMVMAFHDPWGARSSMVMIQAMLNKWTDRWVKAMWTFLKSSDALAERWSKEVAE